MFEKFVLNISNLLDIWLYLFLRFLYFLDFLFNLIINEFILIWRDLFFDDKFVIFVKDKFFILLILIIFFEVIVELKLLIFVLVLVVKLLDIVFVFLLYKFLELKVVEIISGGIGFVILFNFFVLWVVVEIVGDIWIVILLIEIKIELELVNVLILIEEVVVFDESMYGFIWVFFGFIVMVIFFCFLVFISWVGGVFFLFRILVTVLLFGDDVFGKMILRLFGLFILFFVLFIMFFLV